MRERWLGATGVKVPEIAVEGEDLEIAAPDRVLVGGTEHAALVLAHPTDPVELRHAYAEGIPIVVRVEDAAAVESELERPEVACVVVPPERRELRELDLRRLKYG